MDKPKPKIKNLKSKIIFFGILLFLFFAYVFPFLLPNGVEKFSGVEKQAAQKAYDHVMTLRGINFPIPLTAKIENIYPAPAEECGDIIYSPDPNNTRYYAATVKNVWYFGIQSGSSFEILLCRAEG